ncbi:putative solute carrier family 35 member C1 [Fasciola gigantica]|uniref:Putative solute carrier family 35 member C1 n=1 Tax=Fasciola gigantica TaxID=46835 RepID=A0A504YLS4_FASGI|nr:putative solute carrier family 35 member C1 [Fasciola gigantica]
MVYLLVCACVRACITDAAPDSARQKEEGCTGFGLQIDTESRISKQILSLIDCHINDMTDESLFSSKEEAKEFLRRLCDQEIVVHVTDGRRYVGRFCCTDRSANLVLGSCIEYPAPADATYEKLQRNLTAVVIPGQHITKIECDRNLLLLPLTSIK